MGKKNRQKWLVLGAVGCLSALALDRFVLPPLMSTWDARAERTAELEELLDDGGLLLERENTIRDRWAAMQGRALPEDRAAAESIVLNAVNGWAENSGLNVTSIKPRWVRSDGPFRKLEVRATALARPESVLRFLHALERDGLPLCIESAKLSSQDDRGRALSLDITFTALAVMDEEA
jgi:Type II secretion system (T2SS), protein M subtype b